MHYFRPQHSVQTRLENISSKNSIMSLYDSVKLNKRRAATVDKQSPVLEQQPQPPRISKPAQANSLKPPIKRPRPRSNLQTNYCENSTDQSSDDDDSYDSVDKSDNPTDKAKIHAKPKINSQPRVILTDISHSMRQESQPKLSSAAAACVGESTTEKLAKLRPDCSILLPAKPASSIDPKERHIRTDNSSADEEGDIRSVDKDEQDPDEPLENDDIGRLVWARWQGQSYPALVVSGRRCHLRPARTGMRWLLWLAEGKVSELPAAGLQPIDNPESLAAAASCRNALLARGMRRLRLELIERRSGDDQDVDKQLADGATVGDQLARLTTEDEAARLKRRPPLSDWVIDCLVDIYRQHKRSLKAVAESEGLRLVYSDEDEDHENHQDTDDFRDDASSYSQSSKFGRFSTPRTVTPTLMSVFVDISNGSLSLNSLCLACGVLGSDLVQLSEHPVFRGSMCKPCLDYYLAVCFSVGDDGWFMYCSVCGRPGNQAMCGSADCGRCFCQACLTLLLGQEAWQRVISDSDWLCYLCQLRTERLIQPRTDWRRRLYCQTEPEEELPPAPSSPHHLPATVEIPLTVRQAKRPLRVLSLFDGIASGLLCLDSAGLSVGAYFASEIDPEAIRVVACNHGDRVQQLGNIFELGADQLKSLMPIDLLIGGSPCNELSGANPNRQGIGSQSGLLFFEFHRILELLRRIGRSRGSDQPSLFWLFENVASMRREDRDYISRFLCREPVRLDASIFSAQRRARLFWGNLPGMLRTAGGIAAELAADVVDCADAGAADGSSGRQRRHLASCIDPRSGRTAIHSSVGCVTTKSGSGRGRGGALPVAAATGLPDALWTTELERLFGFPQHYTDYGLGDLARRKLLGRSWCLPVVAHLLRPLRHWFSVRQTADDACAKKE